MPKRGESHLQLLPVFVFMCVVKPTEHIPHGVWFILLLLGLFTEMYFGVTLDGQNTRFLRVFAFFGAQKPNAGVEFFPDFFFYRYFFLIFCQGVGPYILTGIGGFLYRK